MKKLITLAPLAFVFAAGSALAVDPIAHQMTVTATIPTDSFYVTPAGGGNWMNDPQNLDYAAQTQTLATFSRQLDMKSTTGPITAHLTSPVSLGHTSSSETIGLSVKINNKTLTTTAQEVLPAAQAALGSTVPFMVSADAAPAAGYTPGDYTGIVGMLFETTTP